MNRTIITKGKLLGIGLKKNAKMRKGNSSLGYFDLNGKTITPYNLKHYLRITTNITSSGGSPHSEAKLSKATPSGDPKGSLEVNQTNNLRFKLEERLEALRSNNFKGLPKSVELDTAGIHLSDSSKARGSCPPSKTKSLELP